MVSERKYFFTHSLAILKTLFHWPNLLIAWLAWFIWFKEHTWAHIFLFVLECVHRHACECVDMHIYRCAHGRVCTWMPATACVLGGGVSQNNLCESVLFLLCGSRYLNSGHRAWQQTPAPGLFVYTSSYIYLARTFFHSADILHLTSLLFVQFSVS
jgi:hypothetical protein